jgi:hypothetical protein
MTDEAIKLVDTIDFSNVLPADRIHMRDIMLKVVTFHEIMPKLDVNIYKAPGHYNVTVGGWNQHVSVKKLYDQFLNPTTRIQVMDYIRELNLIPASDEDGKGKLFLSIASSKGLNLRDKKIK